MDELRVAVLGPLRVARGGTPVRLGPKLVELLSVLLIEVGRAVPITRLVEMLWGDPAPDSAATTLRSHISHLRRALAGDGMVIRTVGRSYALETGPGVVDTHRFERLCGQARELLDAGSTEDGAALLGDALALWRGPAYVDVAGRPFAMPETVRLGALRRSARRHLAGALSDLGRQDEALGHLADAVGDDPHDGGARRLLALALYADERVDEALDVCRQGMDLLRERGIDAPDLQRLQRDILRRAAPVPPVAVPVDQRRTPRLLPPDPSHFVGRTAELANALDRLRWPDRPRALVVTGPAGIGKTYFGVRLAHALADDFPDGQLYVNLRGFGPTGSPMPPEEALRCFLDALGVPPRRIPSTVDVQAGLFRSLTAGRRMLVLLDNARDVDQVRPLLPGSEGCLAVVTSRDQLRGAVIADGACPVTLDLLSPAEAADLLTRRLGPQLAADPTTMSEIVDRCGGLPLALAIVSARAAGHPQFPFRLLADELRAAQGSLDAFSTGDATADVRAVLSWSHNGLGEPARRLFELLGVPTGADIGAPAAASLAGLPVSATRPPLAELARRHLVAEQAPGRYSGHDLLRAHAAELAAVRPEHEVREARHRLLDHYLHTAVAADHLLWPKRDAIALRPVRSGVVAGSFHDQASALDWWGLELGNLLAAVEQADRAGLDGHTWRLAWTLANYLDSRGRWHDWATVARLAVTAARREGDLGAEADAHRILGAAYVRLRRFPEARAEYRLALALFDSLADRVGQAFTYRSLGWLSEQQGEIREALAHDVRALRLFEAAGHDVGRANSLNSIGWCHALLGEADPAIRHCERALALLQKLGDRAGEAATWDSLGYAHRLGNDIRAVECYTNAVAHYREMGHRPNEAVALSHLGTVYDGLGDLTAARIAWRRALAIFQKLDHPEAARVRARLRWLATPSPVSGRRLS